MRIVQPDESTLAVRMVRPDFLDVEYRRRTERAVDSNVWIGRGDGKWNPRPFAIDLLVGLDAANKQASIAEFTAIENAAETAVRVEFDDAEGSTWTRDTVALAGFHRQSPISEHGYRCQLRFWSDQIKWAVVPPEPPPAPTALAATDITHNSFWANWEAVAGATLYRLDVATDSEFNTLVLSNQNVGDVTTYEVLFLDPETNYWYQLRAENAAGASANSNVIAVTTTEAVGLYTDTYEDVY